MNAEELLEQYALGERNFAKVNLQQVQLQNIDLSGCDFREADFRAACLTNVKHLSLKKPT
jgi:uncharacterized protein YjbI with pentapeptide repeats